MTTAQILLTILSGAFSGVSLGLIGGGGSVLAVPMLIYLVGMTDAHIAIGTSALAVSASAAFSLAQHARAGNVRWRTAAVFTVAGSLGALAGSTLGKLLGGHKLLFLFGLVMMAVALAMLWPRGAGGGAPESLRPARLAWVSATAVLVGAVSGFFGIGGGFLVVPGLVFSTGMPMIAAVGSSLVAVAAFGLTTAGNYALSGLVDWSAAAEFIGGGVLGGWIGMRLACHLATSRRALNLAYALIVLSVGLYVLIQNLGAFV
jgi:uncharacterized protein